jgi:hypothetical protein
MELNVRIAIPQLFDNKQVYDEIPHVLVLSQHPIKIKISIRCVSVKCHFRKRFVKQITHKNEINGNI